MSLQTTLIITAVACWIIAKIISGWSLLPIDIEIALTGRWSQPVAGAWFRYVELYDNFKSNDDLSQVATYRALHGVSASFQILWFKITVFILPVMYTVVRKPEVLNEFIEKVQNDNAKEVETTIRQIELNDNIEQIRGACLGYYKQTIDLAATIEQLMKMQKISGNAKD
jgi:hypothetical protein